MNKMDDQLLIRNYSISDHDQIIELLRLNTPEYFAPEEEQDLIHYLTHELEHYFVMEISGLIIGAGGINFKGKKTEAYISWDFMHPDFQKRGYGSILLKHRIDSIKSNSEVSKIIVRTSQMVYSFYEKSGFVLTQKIIDFWAKGFDLYEMEYLIS